MTVNELQWKEYNRVGPASEADLARVEKWIERRFPADIRPIIMKHQGQIPIPQFIRDPVSGVFTNFGAMMHCTPSDYDYIPDVLAMFRRSGYPDWLIPISTGGGGQTHFAYDFRESLDEPIIVIVRPELGYDDPDFVVPVAKSFAELITKLESDDT